MTKFQDMTNFPFENISSFREAVISNKARVAADYQLTREWAMSGLHTTLGVQFFVIVPLLLPFILILILLIWWALTKQWLIIFSIPLLLAYILIVMPPAEYLFSRLRKSLLYLSIAFFLYGIFIENNSLIIIFGYALITRASLNHAYKSSLIYFTQAVVFHEDLLHFAWNTGLMNVRMTNGTVYSKNRVFDSADLRR